ncbi:MAG TPA: 16S rRNA (guanine(966)-N(2))-methyltransferase RsmD, partial [Alphaproteobacteria bacterium]|nr:16S rRNA (guanine(966)-N(2))-methyltransferase RsmD [Alphaproteobacteria bacterium]
MRIVGGSRRGRRLTAPEGRALRPTSERAREALFNIIGHREFAPLQLKGARVIDLFAGTGALGLEALSRGAAHLTALESD